ncbi:Pentatricopeptide repeat-containing protein [Apostasia shenzhenica]|uniref:Pentatricopeptide repeat-containing protein n=1 Tax=Apostasia shenzhenica TaxID=1088818 RepID=A0A2I0AL02_9ASPA|nr:Pentatricopeptide repeat-containing protein [Apostasia shenzhenica]
MSLLSASKLRVASELAAPDALAFGRLIQQCADGGLFRRGQQLHARLILLSVLPNNFLGSKLISLYSRCGRLHEARRIFDDIRSKNLFSCNAMLLGYSFHNQTIPALRLASSISSSSLRPDAFTLSSLLKTVSSSSFSSSAVLAKTKEVHSFALRLCYISDLFVSNGLITAYARSGDLVYARKLFDEMPTRDVVSWNSIISGYSQEGHYDACLQLYREMELCKDGVKPNGVTIAITLHACSQLKDLLFGIEVHRSAAESGMKMDATACNSIIGFYARCGSLDYARSLFDSMVDKDGVSYSTMISGYMAYGFVDRAMELFDQIPNPVLSTWNAVIAGQVQNNRFSCVLDLFRSMPSVSFRPNAVTVSSALPAVSYYSNLLSVRQMHCYAIRSDFDRNVFVATAIIDAYAKSGFLEGANKVFVSTKSSSVIVWTAIISAFAVHGDANAALAIFWEMLDKKMKPDSVTFTAVLSACAHAGEVHEARRIIDLVMPKCGISPEAEQYACLVGALSRKGMLENAVEVINSMPFQPNAKMWGALLNGASVYRNVEIGKYTFERLLEMEPGNTGNYIVMANLYSQAGKWKEAQAVREKMEEVGLAKVPGCSWMEESSGLKVFISRDVASEQSEEIYGLLEGLVGLMTEEGYRTGEEIDEENSCHMPGEGIKCMIPSEPKNSNLDLNKYRRHIESDDHHDTLPNLHLSNEGLSSL